MQSTPSWKWLVPRLISRHLRRAHLGTKAAARHCLAFERLEQRSLLTANNSAVLVDSEGPPQGGGEVQILSELLTHSFNVAQSEFQLLETLADGLPGNGPPVETDAKIKFHDIPIIKTVDKATPILFQLNDTLIKFGDDIIKGELTNKNSLDTQKKVDNKVEYLKIKLEEVIISSFNVSKESAEEILKPLFDSADALVDALVADAENLAGRKAGKGQQEFLRLSADILKIENLAIKGELEFLKVGSPGLDVDDFLVKIENVFQKADEALIKLKLDGSELQTALTQFKGQIEGLFAGSGGPETDPISLSASGKFKGGIFLPPIDDTIT